MSLTPRLNLAGVGCGVGRGPWVGFSRAEVWGVEGEISELERSSRFIWLKLLFQ